MNKRPPLWLSDDESFEQEIDIQATTQEKRQATTWGARVVDNIKLLQKYCKEELHVPFGSVHRAFATGVLTSAALTVFLTSCGQDTPNHAQEGVSRTPAQEYMVQHEQLSANRDSLYAEINKVASSGSGKVEDIELQRKLVEEANALSLRISNLEAKALNNPEINLPKETQLELEARMASEEEKYIEQDAVPPPTIKDTTTVHRR